jgi:hypothetical protein
MGHLRKFATLGLTLLLAGGLAGAALGDPARPTAGVSLVLEKDLAQQTVLLDGQILLHVTPVTEMLDAEGALITLADLPVAPNDDGLVEMSPEAMVRYEASASGGKLTATSIVVQGKIAD